MGSACGPLPRADTTITGSSARQELASTLPAYSVLAYHPPVLLPSLPSIDPPACSCPHFPEKEMRAKGIACMQEDWALCSFMGKRNLDQSGRRLHFKTLI